MAGPATTRPAGRSGWIRVFCGGLLLWAAAVLVALATGNGRLLPTVVLLGSFLVPVTFAVWAYERGPSRKVTFPLLVRAFVVGGVLGLLGAALLERYLIDPALWTRAPWAHAGVGLIEEAAKVAALMAVAHRVRVRGTRDGLVLGAAVGFGFAAFESAGYAYGAVASADGFGVRALVETEVARGLLAPVGHGLWTAIAGGVLFTASPTRWRVTADVVLAWFGVAALHCLWNSMPALVAGRDPLALWAGLTAISLAGVGWLVVLTPRRSRAAGAAGASPSPPG